MQAIVYTALPSNRVSYIFSTLLSAIGFNDVVFTNNEVNFKETEVPKINYSKERVCENEVWISPSALLFEKGIEQQKIDFFEWNKLTCFFNSSEGDFPFDLFAAAFYLLSRYEEYLPHTKDTYGRYAHQNSLAFQNGFLDIPLVNFWLSEFKKTLSVKFQVPLTSPSFRFIPTYDIDLAWSYLHKGFVRNFGGLLKDISNLNLSSTKERIQVLLKKKVDPFDSYEWLNKLHESNNLQPLYFFLLAQKNKGFDKNILPQKVALKQLIKSHSDKYKVGIHPSWQSEDNDKILKKEIALLNQITGRNIYQSRQHYIRMTLPDTYRNLLLAGITDDYSMGYGSINGFRASYCLPYKWYDLKQEHTTDLIIHPYCYMDANSFYEQHLTATEALDEMKYYHEIVKRVNGELITIWHNHFLGKDKMFKGWKNAYESMIAGL